MYCYIYTCVSKLWRGMWDSANSMGWNKVEGRSGLVLVAAKGLEQVRLSQFGFGLNLLLSSSLTISFSPCWLFLLSRCPGAQAARWWWIKICHSHKPPAPSFALPSAARKLTLRSPWPRISIDSPQKEHHRTISFVASPYSAEWVWEFCPPRH
jgi:hypothetical protein